LPPPQMTPLLPLPYRNPPESWLKNA